MRDRAGTSWGAAVLPAFCLSIALSSSSAVGETVSQALAAAYSKSPDLNAQRAGTRAADEYVPGALAGYRPTVSGEVDGGIQQLNLPPPSGPSKTTSHPWGGGVSVTETLFNGGRTFNSVKQAKSKVFQSREDLRSEEVTVLRNGVTAYMNVLRDTAILDLRRDYARILQQQLGQTQERFKYGEVTRTDIFQAETSLAQASVGVATATSNLQASIAGYQQVIGEVPKQLTPARPIESLLPRTLDAALSLGQASNPVVQSALHAVDVAALQVKITEGQLYPTLGVTGNVQQRYDYNNIVSQRLFQASLLGQINIPIYEGGAVYAQARQAKELLGQAQLQSDIQRNQVRAAIISAWSGWQSTKTQLAESEKEVHAAESAVSGVREEAKLGERTTFDVLTAQQNLLNARLDLIEAQYGRVLGSYIVLAAIGTLSAQTLGLTVAAYDPKVHFDQVKDKWIGLRTPDGR